MGKTAFALNLTENILKKYKVPIIFFSLEMSKEQLIYRLLSNETGISQTRLKVGNLYKEDWYKLKESIQNYSRLPFFIDDQANLTTQDIRSKIKIPTRKNFNSKSAECISISQGGGTRSRRSASELSQPTAGRTDRPRTF